MTEKRNKDRNVPTLRFPEFVDEWLENSLGEIASFSKGKGISKAEITEDGQLECIRYGELYTYYNEVIDEVKSKTNLDRNSLVLSEANDVIIPASGETQLDIATASCVTRSDIALGGDLNIIKTPNNGVFLSYYLNSRKKLEIASLSQGISVVHLYAKQLSTLKISIPSKKEQDKIAGFLALLDQRIKTQNKIIEQLESLIKALKTDLLNGKYRFKNEREELFPTWEQKQVMDIAFKKASNISANTLEAEVGEFKIYGATGVLKQISYFKEEQPYISIVKDGAGVGRLFLCEEKTSVLGTLDILKSYSGIDLQFLYYLLSVIDFSKYVTGSTIPHIYFKDYSSEKVNVPCLSEQKRISTFLFSIDNKIDLERNLLNEYLSKKKYLLNSLLT